jgi:hypothetical protein
MTDSDLTAIVSQYRGKDVGSIVDRLGSLNVTSDDLRAALDHDPDISGPALRVDVIEREPTSLSVDELLRIVVLAEERTAALRHEVAETSGLRRAALQAAADEEPIVGLASRLRVSRQAVSQTVNGADAAGFTARTFSKFGRYLQGER